MISESEPAPGIRSASNLGSVDTGVAFYFLVAGAGTASLGL